MRKCVMGENMINVSIKKLFGNFDYDITLCENGMSIITGPNGFGKSTIIKCVKAVSDSDLLFFYDLQFESMELKVMPGNHKIQIRKLSDGLEINQDIINEKIILNAKRALMRKHGIEIDDENIEMYQSTIENMKNIIGKVEYIEEQRLITMEEEREQRYVGNRIQSQISRNVRQTIESIPDKLMFIIRRSSMMYSRTAGQLDSTFPIRLFHEKKGIKKEEFDLKIQKMNEKTKKLDEYGFYTTRPMEKIEFQEEDARALKVYFEDFEKKYKQYEHLIEKLDLFKKMINSRFKFKHIEISEEYGIRVVNDKEQNISLKKLSSGEKETIVLFYRLLFEVEDGTILLIDEPEISLHIAWQRMFVEDLLTIVKIKNLNAIVATHSAQIVNGNFDIQVDLGEYYSKWIQSEKMKN